MERRRPRRRHYPRASMTPHPHPGEILKECFMYDNGLSAGQLAREVGLSTNRISEVCRGRVGISADLAIRLGRYFGNGAQHWLNMQDAYELDQAKQAHDYSRIPEYRAENHCTA